MLASCTTQRLICPAYQSAFLFDKTKQKESFFLYNENKNQPREILASNSKTLNLPPRDSSWDKSHVVAGPALPIERRVKKDKYLLIPRKTYKQAIRALQTIPMKPVYPKKEDDTLDIKKELDSAARSITDTLNVSASAKESKDSDSVYVISKEKEKFNLDQDIYMWYFRDILVLPDVRIAMEGAKADKARATGKAGKKGFFSKLISIFKKKNKSDQLVQPKSDSTKIDSDEEFLSRDTTETVLPVKQEPSSNKNKKVKVKKTKKEKPQAVTPKKSDPKKEDDDGF